MIMNIRIPYTMRAILITNDIQYEHEVRLLLSGIEQHQTHALKSSNNFVCGVL